MAKELERAGLPVAMISAMPALALNVGANRVVKGSRIEHVCGNPALPPEKDHALAREIVMAAFRALQSDVCGPTLFEPAIDPAIA